jgi:hypothetical protein
MNNENNTNKPQIRIIATHPKPHLDEAMALALLRHYRPDVFAQETEFVFFGGGRLPGEDPKKSGGSDPDVLSLGILGADGDEHGRADMGCEKKLMKELNMDWDTADFVVRHVRKTQLITLEQLTRFVERELGCKKEFAVKVAAIAWNARLQCSASRVAETYGLIDRPAVRAVLRHVLRMDANGSHQGELAKDMICVARHAGLIDVGLLLWGLRASLALLREADELAKAAAAASAGERGEAGEPDIKINVRTESVRWYVHKHFPNEHDSWAEVLAHAEDVQKKMWLKARAAVAQARVLNVNERKFVIVEDDSPDVANASRGQHGHDLILVIRSNGHRQILSAGQGDDGRFNLMPLLNSIRREEMKVRGLEPLSPEEEASPINLARCACWFGQVIDGNRRVGFIFNGTQEAGSDIEPTKIDKTRLQELCEEFLKTLPSSKALALPTVRHDSRRHHGHARQRHGRRPEEPRRKQGPPPKVEQVERPYTGPASLADAFKDFKK